MEIALLYTVLGTALYMLGSKDLIMRPLWSRYPSAFDAFMSCPSCSGTWYGLVLGALGAWQGWAFLGLDPTAPVTIAVVALWCKVTVPLLAAVHIASLSEPDL